MNTSPSSSPAPATSPNFISMSVGQVWAVVAIAAAAAVSILSFGYTQGKQAGEVQAGKELAAVQGNLGKTEADLRIQTDRALRAQETIKQYQAYVLTIKSEIEAKDQKLQEQSDHFQQSSGCRFTQSQLQTLEKKIDSLNESKRFPSIFGSNSSEQEANRLRKLDAELEQLQERAIAFTSQLGTCPR